MNFLAGLIGGAAQTGANILERENKADYENSLAIKRQVEIEKLQEKRAAALLAQKRAQDVTDAKTIQGDSEAKRVERAQGIINQDTGLNYSPDEVKKIIADPTWVENYGAIYDKGKLVTPSTDRTRAQELNDKADAAMVIGRMDMEKGFRDQQNVELTNTRLDNQAARDDARTAGLSRLADIKETQTENRRVADAAKDDTRNRQVDAMLAKIGAKGDGADKAPAEVKAVQWYIENKDDPVAMEAWDKVHQTKSKNVVSIASDLITRDPNAGGKNALTVDKAWEMASVLYDKSTSKNSGVPAPGAPAIPASRAAQFKVIRN